MRFWILSTKRRVAGRLPRLCLTRRGRLSGCAADRVPERLPVRVEAARARALAAATPGSNVLAIVWPRHGPHAFGAKDM